MEEEEFDEDDPQQLENIDNLENIETNNFIEDQGDFINEEEFQKEYQKELENLKKENNDNNEELIQDDDNDSDDDSRSDKRFKEEEQKDFIHWFCKLKGNEYLVEIDEDFLKQKENLIGIKCDKFMKTLLSEKPSEAEIKNVKYKEDLSELRDIYGLIHKRFINTPLGLSLVREKFLDGVYGYCPRLLCNKQVLLPLGLSEDIRYSQVKVFCPLCQEVYKPRENFYAKKEIKFDLPDGVFFGTSFPQNFLLSFPDLDPRIINSDKYIPKLYGFRIFGKYGSKYFTKDQDELDKKLIEFGIKKC